MKIRISTGWSWDRPHIALSWLLEVLVESKNQMPTLTFSVTWDQPRRRSVFVKKLVSNNPRRTSLFDFCISSGAFTVWPSRMTRMPLYMVSRTPMIQMKDRPSLRRSLVIRLGLEIILLQFVSRTGLVTLAFFISYRRYYFLSQQYHFTIYLLTIHG